MAALTLPTRPLITSSFHCRLCFLQSSKIPLSRWWYVVSALAGKGPLVGLSGACACDREIAVLGELVPEAEDAAGFLRGVEGDGEGGTGEVGEKSGSS